MSRAGEAIRLAVGTFSALPVPPPRTVDRRTAGIAVPIAPLAVLPVGLLVGVIAWAATAIDLPAIVVGALSIGAGALATRGFHLDGLADTADALASSYDRERALTVARTGDVGPAGAATLVLVLMLQVGAAGSVASLAWGPVAVGVLWCLSRAAGTIGLSRGVPAAREDGLGATFAGSVGPVVLAATWSTVAAASGALAVAADLSPVQGVAAVVATLAVVTMLVVHVVRRLGGIIGDAVGASIEIALAVLLLGFAAVL